MYGQHCNNNKICGFLVDMSCGNSIPGLKHIDKMSIIVDQLPQIIDFEISGPNLLLTCTPVGTQYVEKPQY